MAIKTNIIISHSCLDGAAFKEAIDLGLVCAAFDQLVNIIFIDNGIYNLVAGQNSSIIHDKNQADIVKGLAFYDIESVIIETESLENSSLMTNDLFPSITLKSKAQIKQLNIDADNMVTF